MNSLQTLHVGLLNRGAIYVVSCHDSWVKKKHFVRSTGQSFQAWRSTSHGVLSLVPSREMAGSTTQIDCIRCVQEPAAPSWHAAMSPVWGRIGQGLLNH
eukprot:4843786-Amphidinium_carterae.2